MKMRKKNGKGARRVKRGIITCASMHQPLGNEAQFDRSGANTWRKKIQKSNPMLEENILSGKKSINNPRILMIFQTVQHALWIEMD